MILLLLLSWEPMVSVAARYSYHGGVITLSSVKAEWNLKAQSYLAFHLTSSRQTDPETHVGGPRRREILGFKLFSLDISHKPWQTILRRYLNWIAPWEEKIVSWQYNSSKVSPPTNWKVLQYWVSRYTDWEIWVLPGLDWCTASHMYLFLDVIGHHWWSRAGGGWII